MKMRIIMAKEVKVREYISSKLDIHRETLQGNLDDVISRLQSAKLKAEEMGYESVKMLIEVEWTPNSNFSVVTLIGQRPETSKEKSRRLKKESNVREQNKKVKSLKDAKERKEYERLKKKFDLL